MTADSRPNISDGFVVNLGQRIYSGIFFSRRPTVFFQGGSIIREQKMMTYISKGIQQAIYICSPY